jgi:hypothetical protein
MRLASFALLTFLPSFALAEDAVSFRKEVAPGETANIYTDVKSKIAKYERLFAFMSTMSVVFIPIIVAMTDSIASPFAKATFALLILLLLVEVGIAGRLWLRIQQLKRLSAISA